MCIVTACIAAELGIKTIYSTDVFMYKVRSINYYSDVHY
jgi:hypothetical protein